MKMNVLKPQHTFGAVVDELAEGISNGTILLSRYDIKEPVFASDDDLRKSPQRAPTTFENKNESAQKDEADSPSTVAEGVLIKGTIRGSSDLSIDGTVEGNVDLSLGNLLVIGRSSVIVGNISAYNVIISGTIRGKVFALNNVEIRREAKVFGDISCAHVSIEEGALFKGGIAIVRPKRQPFVQPNVEARTWNAPEEINKFV